MASIEYESLEQQPSVSSSDFQEVQRLVWGNQIKDDLFLRWSQGFVFSPEEPTALVQLEGGPCAIIAPVQAFILKYILSDPTALNDNLWRRLPSESVDEYLVKALTEVLLQAKNRQSNDAASSPPAPPNSPAAKLALLQQAQPVVPALGFPQSSVSLSNTKTNSNNNDTFSLVFLNEPLSTRVSQESDPETLNPPPSILDSNRRLQRPEQEIFHRNLRVLHLESREQVDRVLREKLDALKGHYGILQYLYSLILTKGTEALKEEMSEDNPLIDSLHGHGSQSLINLMLTGKGVNYVWDGEQDVGGLKLVGIAEPVEIGFLTLLERLRYCEVGSFFKNPRFPVWVVGSETHLTVLFSTNMNLVCPETPAEIARRVFHSFDHDKNNFISAPLLEDVLKTLGLVSDAEYVELMKKRLDPESYGIILLNDFLDEFYPSQKLTRPDSFQVFHYNGLPRSSSDRKVTYHEGNAILLETDIRSLSEDNKILTCLQTKWPSIDITWHMEHGTSPSIN